MPVYRSIDTYSAGLYPWETCVSMPSEDRNVAAGVAIVAACAWLAATSAAARTAPLMGFSLRDVGCVLGKNPDERSGATIQSDEPARGSHQRVNGAQPAQVRSACAQA